MKIKIIQFDNGDDILLTIDGKDKTAWALLREEVEPVRDELTKYLDKLRKEEE